MELSVEIHEPVLIASQETKLKLAWMSTALPHMTGMDILVVTREDLLRNTSPYNLENQEIIAENLREIYNAAGIPTDVVAYYGLEDYQEDILGQVAMAQSLDFDGDKKPDMGVIVAPDLELTPKGFVTLMTGIPAEYIKDNLPGTGKDYRDIIIAHEAGHTVQPNILKFYGDIPLPFEVDADGVASSFVLGNIGEDKFSTPETLDILHATRIISGIGQDSVLGMVHSMMDGKMPLSGLASHSTHLMVDGNGFVDNMDVKHFVAPMVNNELIAAAAGTYITFAGMRELQEGSNIPEDQRVFQSATDFMNTVGDPLKSIELGRAYLATNPAMAYTTIKILDEKGYFPDNHLGSEHVRKVLEFFDKYIDVEKMDQGYYNDMNLVLAALPSMDDVRAEAEQEKIQQAAPRKGPQFRP